MVAVLSFAGCPVQPVEGTDAGTSPKYRNAVTEAFGPMFCDRATKCCAGGQVDCVQEASNALALFGDFGPVVDAGGVSLDQEWLQRCRSDVGALPCDMPVVLLSFPACRATLVGHGKVGEACPGYVGCEAGLVCVLGRCAAVAAAGGSCDAGAPLNCVSGVCITAGCAEGLMCLNGICTALAQPGETCSPSGRRCAFYSAVCDCAQPLSGCLDGGVCTSLLPLDAGCAIPRQCASAWCGNGKCAEAGEPLCR